MPRLEVQLFGPPRVRVDGAPIPPLRTRKGLWLLCVLALRADREVDRSWVAGVLWPDSLQEDALANLRRSLTDLRRALGAAADCLESPSLTSLRLTGAVADVTRFDTLRAGHLPEGWREALELGRRSLLEGCDEEWAVEERTVREAACVELAERLGEVAFADCRFAEAADWFAEAARKDAFRESAWRRRLESLAKAGAYGAALEVYRTLRDQLWASLHTAPSPETTAIYQSIREAARGAGPGAGAARVGGVDGIGSAAPSPSPLAPVLPPSLPSPLTGLIGREEELRRVTEEARQARLVTLTGSGGVGKTRLALEAAHTVAADFPGGAWWVELAPIASASLILPAVAQAVGLKEEPGVDLLEGLARRWGAQKTLIVLDNCEHLVDEASVAARTLLQRIPGATILATSRQPLELPGERVFPVQPFSVSNEMARMAEEIGRLPAIRLFVERATARDPSFSLTADNAAAILHICRRLDGIPLAIELAAARVQLLGVEQIALRLSDRFRLLSGGQRTALPHHRTLRSLIDWSYELLAPDEARLFRRLGVFTGGCTTEAVQAVCAEPGTDELDLIDLLNSLLTRSLMQVQETSTGRRYWLLESIREYAREKLRDAGEWDDALARHADWSLATAARWTRQLEGAEQKETMRLFAAEMDNFRYALDHLTEPEWRLGLSIRLWRYWQMSGQYTEGRARLDRTLAECADVVSPERVVALRAAGTLARLQGDFTGARGYLRTALAICEQHGFRQELPATLTALGVIQKDLGDFQAAKARYEQALSMHEEDGDEVGMCSALNNLGMVSMLSGDLDAAHAFHSRTLEMRTARNDLYGACSSLVNLGSVAYYRSDREAARDWFGRMERLARESGFDVLLPIALVNQAIIDGEQGRFEDAEKRLEEAIATKRAVGDRRGIANALAVYGQLQVRKGEPDQARAPLAESLRLIREIRERRESVFVLEAVVEMTLRSQEQAAGAVLLEGAHRLREELRYPVLPSDRPLIESMQQSLLEALGPDGYARARQQSAVLTWEELLAVGEGCVSGVGEYGCVGVGA